MPDDDNLVARADEILGHYGLAGSQTEAFGTGLINDTFLVTVDPEVRFVLQRLNKVFPPEVNVDIDALTRHFALQGAVTPRLMPADNGDLWVADGERVWRMLNFVPGDCFDRLESEEQAAAAGALLGAFHREVRGLELELHNGRLGVHDTARHLQALRDALEQHRDHRNFKAVSVLADEIFAAAGALPELPALPDRLVHGDPKISNLVFDSSTGAGVCMIDLDTLAHMPLPLELGDAFRSWCNPRGEDTYDSEFRLDLFAAAVAGYAGVTSAFLLPAEWQSFVTASRIIMIELAARFATDALNESYFGWNSLKFADASAQNQVRAAGQLQLYESLTSQNEAAEKIVYEKFAG
jgi:Ser/Thr protein kinase RdoA (MazF antagonist)